MMKFEFKNVDDGDIVETVKFTRNELRAIARMAEYYTTTSHAITAAYDVAAERLVKSVDKVLYPAASNDWWAGLFTKNHE